MLATSEAILEAWLSPARQLAVRVQVNQSSYGSEDVASLSFDSGSISGEVYQIGSTYMNTVQIVFPTIIETIKEDQEVIPELGILVDGEYHYSKLGHFFITEFNRDRNAKTTTITASDKMIYMEGVYESKLTYSKPYREVALEIANLAGVEINQASFASLGTLAIRKPVGYTYRQAIGLIAQFEGGFASFNRDGELEIRRLRPTEFEVTPESYLLKGFSKNENAYRIGGITVRIGEEETDVLRVGSTNGSQIELENKVMTQTLLKNIWDLVKNINYFPFELKWRGCPLLEAGDWMYVTDRDGKRYSVPNLSYSLAFNGGLSGDSKATTNSSSQATYKYRGTLKQRVDWLDSLLSSNGWNQNYYDTTEPKNPKEGDIWFKQNGQDKEIWIYEKDKDGNLSWVLQVSTATDPGLIEAIEEVGEKVEQAQSDAGQALTNANEAVSKATDASNKADQSSAAVIQAQTDATMALNNADQAKANAQDALAKAGQADATSNQAKSDAATALSNANEAKGNASAALSNSATAIINAQNALDQYASLSFDNRNLLLNTAIPKELTGTATETQLRTLANFSKSTFGAYGFEPGKSIAFRATIEVSGSGFGGYFNFRMGPNVWASLNPTGQRYPITKTETLTFETVLPIKSTWGDNRYVDIRLDGVPTTVNLRITAMQLTYSSQVTPWQRAPEDVQVSIDNLGNEVSTKVSQTTFDTLNQKVTSQGTQISQNKSDIALKANQSTVDTLAGRVSTAETAITVNANAIELKANQSVVDTLTGRVSTAEGSIDVLAGKVELKANQSEVDTLSGKVTSNTASLTVQADKIAGLITKTDGQDTLITNLQAEAGRLSSTISSVRTDLDNLAIGGRNFILNTAKTVEFKGNGATNQIVGSMVFAYATLKDCGFSAGDTVTISVGVGIYGSGFAGAFRPRIGSAVWQNLTSDGGTIAITGARTYNFETTITLTADNILNNHVEFRLDNVPDTVNFRVKRWQLEGGNTATGWSPAPEDLATVESVTNLTQTVDSISGTVTANKQDADGKFSNQQTAINANKTAIELKASQTVVDSLTGRVSTAEGSISTLAGQVALKAEKSYVDTVKNTVDSVRSDLTVEAGKVTALNTLTDGHTAQIGSLQSSYDGLSATVSKVETDLNGKASVTDLANLSITVSTIQTTVANKAEQSQVTQLAGQITSIVSDVSNIKAVGTNLWAPSYYASNQYYIDASGITVANTTYLSTNHIWVGSNKSVMVSVFEYTGATTGRIVVAFYNGTTFISRAQINPNTTTESQVTFPAGTTQIAFSAPIAGRYKFEFGVKATDYSVSPLDTATTSQITQLADRMNFRITNSDGSITQIDLANKVISLSGEQVNITGNTYIANGVIGTAQIKDAAIIDAKIGTLSASKITTGILNAANVAIINLDVNNLTGNLTNFVKSYWTDAFGSQLAITASAITMVTSKANLSLTANALRLYSADYTGASAVFALGRWRDSSSTQTSATGIYIGSSSAISSNTDFTAFLNRNGASYMLYAENTMNYGSNTNIVKNALNIFGTTHIWGGTTIHDALGIYGYMAFHGGDFARITVDPNAATFNFRIKAGVTDGSYFWFNNKIISSDGWASSSLLSLKNVRRVYEGDALSEICKTDIVEYSYKNRPNDVELSPIIDDVHRTPEYYLPDIITDGKTVNMYAMSSLTWVAIKQLNQKIEDLERKLSA